MHCIQVAEYPYFIQELKKFIAPRYPIVFKILCNNHNQDTDKQQFKSYLLLTICTLKLYFSSRIG